MTATTERLWESLPEHLRVSDRAGGLRLIVQALGNALHDPLIDTILGISRSGELPSTLADPTVIPSQWLPWLRAVLGYQPPSAPGMDVPQERQRARMTQVGRLHTGTPTAIIGAVADLWQIGDVGGFVWGDDFVWSDDFVWPEDPDVSVTGRWRDDDWLIAVHTNSADTPDTGETIATWADFEDSWGCWADLEEDLPTWEAWEGADTIRAVITRALRHETPAGCVICPRITTV